MTTTLLIDGSTAPDPRALHPSTASRPARHTGRPAAEGVKLSFGGLLRAERIKLSSLRSVRFTLAATLIAGLGLSGLIALLWSSESIGQTGAQTAADLQQYLLMTASISAPFIALVFGVLGVLVMSSEYASGLILSTLVAAPRRGTVFLAKAVVLAAASALTATIVIGGGLLLGTLFEPAAAAQILTVQVVAGALGTAAYLTLLALFAFGIATLTRNAAAGIGIVAGITFVAPIAFSMLLMTNWAWVPAVTNYLPTQLGNTLAMGIMQGADAAGMGTLGLGYWGSLIAMIGWAAVTLIPAVLVFQRRDAH